ncbi:hypothetical protein DXG01_014026 [Tephrocybe rancida]|nr:hypothetical protein DXG01_014026 [Tephrocybe rancida]
MASSLVQHRVGGWLPQDHSVLERWLERKISQLNAQKKPAPFVQVIQDFQTFIEGDATILSLFQKMFVQVPNKPPYNVDPTQQPQVRDYITMLRLLNMLLTEAPEFSEYDLVGFPINAILDWPMGTPAGFTAFYLDSVNEHLRNILNEWGVFLSSPASCHVLTTEEGGWFSHDALVAMGGFTVDYIHDPEQPHFGFTSWDDFFTRRFKPGRRPILIPDDPRVIVSACESTVYNIAQYVQDHDLFWLKEKSYSLSDMLSNPKYLPEFINGTVYQAFLSALKYHRWHAPVNGTVVEIQTIPGTYYSESPTAGMDPAAPNNSQGYITAVATRVIIYIQADNPDIGLMAFMAVGMAEVSTCRVTVQKGNRVVQGDELGAFHFGGSTHCLIFQPQTNIEWTDTTKVGSNDVPYCDFKCILKPNSVSISTYLVLPSGGAFDGTIEHESPLTPIPMVDGDPNGVCYKANSRLSLTVALRTIDSPHHRVGGWLPKDHSVLKRWLEKKIKHLDAQERPAPLVPVIKDFEHFIEADPTILSLFKKMFIQVPDKPPYNEDPTQQPQVRNYKTMLRMLNLILTEAPGYSDYDLVGFPINAILDWPMGTPAGFTAFYLDSVNKHFQSVLSEWGKFLDSPASRGTLNTEPGGWFSQDALTAMGGFVQDFICDPAAPHYGFRSWDDFFTRKFRPGRRPVLLPNDPRVVVSACESEVYNISPNVQAHDLFWLKENAYSLSDMLANPTYLKNFEGGTVYQAFLSALKYHRWHAPVNGIVVETQTIPGTYYSEAPTAGMDPAAPNNSQGYITAVAARVIVYIQADNKEIGLMAFMAVGMAEVSTCQITVSKGQRIKQGDEIGAFHFGGSTHCLIFRPETKVQWVDTAKVGNNIQVNEAIAFVDNDWKET